MSAYSSCVNVRGILTNRSVTRHSQLNQSTIVHLTQCLLYSAAAFLSGCRQANTHPTFPLFRKSRDKETTVAGWASQLAKLMLAMHTLSPRRQLVP